MLHRRGAVFEPLRFHFLEFVEMIIDVLRHLEGVVQLAGDVREVLVRVPS